jgi:soluble lytic murein transglycosylase-like protein
MPSRIKSPFYTRCIVLARTHRAAANLAIAVDSAFVHVPSTSEALPIGGSVVGSRGMHSFASVSRIRATGTLIVGWNLDPHDPALRFVKLNIEDTDPSTVIKSTWGSFLVPRGISTNIGDKTLEGKTLLNGYIPSTASLPPGIERPAPAPRSGPSSGRWSQGAIRALVRTLSAQHGMQPEFVLAVADEESNFNPLAHSTAGAIGVMQLMPSTVVTLHVSDPWDPVQNVTAGIAYLKLLWRRLGDFTEVLAAYHSGSHALETRGISEADRVYIDAVRNRYEKYVRQSRSTIQ